MRSGQAPRGISKGVGRVPATGRRRHGRRLAARRFGLRRRLYGIGLILFGVGLFGVARVPRVEVDPTSGRGNTDARPERLGALPKPSCLPLGLHQAGAAQCDEHRRDDAGERRAGVGLAGQGQPAEDLADVAGWILGKRGCRRQGRARAGVTPPARRLESVSHGRLPPRRGCRPQSMAAAQPWGVSDGRKGARDGGGQRGLAEEAAGYRREVIIGSKPSQGLPVTHVEARLSLGGGIDVGRCGNHRPVRRAFRRCKHVALIEREDRTPQPIPGRGTQLFDGMVNGSLRLIRFRRLLGVTLSGLTDATESSNGPQLLLGT